MKDIVNQIHTRLLKKKLTIAVAESCTGGLTSSLLTQTPGSSRYFIMGVTAYSNTVKINLLKIPSSVIAQKGAVSSEVAALMAKNIKIIAKTDFGIGITGIAGPSGGTKQKPVGTVFIAINGKSRQICKRFVFKGSRITIRKKTTLKALELLKSLLTVN